MTEALHGKVFALEGNNDEIGRHQGINRQKPREGGQSMIT